MSAKLLVLGGMGRGRRAVGGPSSMYADER